jgi:DNA helicase HerA-like ATPase
MDGATAPVITFGTVAAIEGARARVVLDMAEDGSGFAGPVPPQIGQVVRIDVGEARVFGVVIGLRTPAAEQAIIGPPNQIMDLDLIGEILETDAHARFRRGVSEFPRLGDRVSAAGSEDLWKIFTRSDREGVRVGCVHQDPSIPANIFTDDLLGKHFAVLGTTGSGKSCALAAIVLGILSKHPHGHVLILDPHNEYGAAFGELADVISPANLDLPYWLLNFDEMKELIIGESSRMPEIEAAILNHVIVEAKKKLSGGTPDFAITVDTPVPYRLSDVTRIIDDLMGKYERPLELAPYMRIKDRFNSLQADRRYAFMFPGLMVRDEMTRLLSRIFRVPVAGKPVTIFDTSGVPTEILNVVVSMLCRLTFDFALWNDRTVPILLVCEEAHRYAPSNEKLGFEPTKRAIARIALEGRKYGVSLALVTQRPSELASNILSQCNTIFAMRITNNRDREYLAAAMPESGSGMLEELPALRAAEAIAIGEGVPVPLRIMFDPLPDDRRPHSNTAKFSDCWDQDNIPAEFLTEVVSRWRRQR